LEEKQEEQAYKIAQLTPQIVPQMDFSVARDEVKSANKGKSAAMSTRMASAGPTSSASPRSSIMARPVTKSSTLSSPSPLPPPSHSVASPKPSASAPLVPSAAVVEQKKSNVQSPSSSSLSSSSSLGTDVDYSKIPAVLDKKFEELDEDSALRPTIIKPGTTWTKQSQKSLLSDPKVATLSTEEQKVERNKAFDLLDALSRSGALSIDYASLHVVLASTHCFDKSLMDTVLKDNVNPIEKVERSTLIVATTIQHKHVEELIKVEHYDRVRTYSPMLFALPPPPERGLLEFPDYKDEGVSSVPQVEKEKQ